MGMPTLKLKRAERCVTEGRHEQLGVIPLGYVCVTNVSTCLGQDWCCVVAFVLEKLRMIQYRPAAPRMPQGNPQRLKRRAAQGIEEPGRVLKKPCSRCRGREMSDVCGTWCCYPPLCSSV